MSANKATTSGNPSTKKKYGTSGGKRKGPKRSGSQGYRAGGGRGRPHRDSRDGHQPRRQPVRLPEGPNEFVDLGVAPELAGQLLTEGIEKPFPIQAATIPDALARRDILGRGRTGSGKTLAFGLPLLTRLAAEKPGKRQESLPRGLILVPTRELPSQVHDALRPLAEVLGLRVAQVIGGTAYGPQIRRLSRGVDVIIATPGRLDDLIEQGAADLSAVRIVVLDEADQMADLGFLPQVEALMEHVPPNGQRLLFSATLDRGVDALVRNHLSDPVEHSTDPGTASVDTMTHRIHVVHNSDKAAAAAEIAANGGRTIVFVRTREGVETVADDFADAGLRSDILHGGMSQRARTRAMDGFKRGRTAVLVCTDVAARGIHVEGIDLVLQMDPPNDHKDYLHRAGRTARAGESGLVVTMSTPRQKARVTRLLNTAGVRPEFRHAANVDEGKRSYRPNKSRTSRDGRYRDGRSGSPYRKPNNRGGQQGGKRPAGKRTRPPADSGN